MTVAETDVAPLGYVERLTDDFGFFLQELWREIELSEPDWIQWDMVDWLEHGPPRRILRGFRGLAKSYITCAYCLWRLLRNPNERVLLVSQSKEFAVSEVKLIRAWMSEVWFLNSLLPRPKTSKRTWWDSATRLDVGPSKPDKMASVAAYGIGSQITGGRPTLAIPDDVETLENTMTKPARELLLHRMREIENLVVPGGEVVILGTPHNEETVYDERVASGYAQRTWPARFPAPDQKVPDLSPALAAALAKGEVQPGDPTCPERFDDDELRHREMLGGRTNWLMQWMMISQLSDSDAHPLKLSDLIVFDTHRDKAPVTIAWGKHNSLGPTMIDDLHGQGLGDDLYYYAPAMIDMNWKEYASVKGWIDPAGRGKDEMAWCIVAQLHGTLYARYVGAVKGGATQENLLTMVNSLKEHRCREVTIESNFGGEMLSELLRPLIARQTVKAEDANEEFPEGWSCSILLEHASGQKEVRIINQIEPVMNQHRLVIDRSLAKDDKLMYQLTRLTQERNCLEHDDRIEALANCVGRFRMNLSQDQDRQKKRFQENLWREEQARRHGKRTQIQRPVWVMH